MRDTSKEIFVRHHLDFKLNAAIAVVTHFQVQNEVMLLVSNGQTLHHVRLQNSRQINLKMPLEEHDRIAHLHLDYSGIHGFVSTVAGENFYVNMRNGNLKPLRRLKGHVISAVAWNTDFNKDSSTGFILLGTTKGAIYETCIASSTGSMNYLKQLAANFADKELSVSGLHLRQLPESESDAYLLLICMPNRLYCLVGEANLAAASQQPSQQVVGTVWSSVMMAEQQSQDAVLQSLFAFKSGKRPQHLAMAKDRENNEVPPSALAIYPVLQSESDDYCQPIRFAWLAADGLSIGQVDVNKPRGEGPDGFGLLRVDININHRRSEGRLDFPLDICLTEYHLLLLYTNRLAAISLFDRTLAFEDFYTGLPKIVGMARDASSQLVWVLAESRGFKYQPSEECRHVWRIFMDQGEFAKAKKVANQLRDKRPFQLIIKKEAEKFIQDRNFVAAAESLAQSEEPFEKVVLLMLRDGPASRNGLKRYIELKLVQMPVGGEQLSRDMLVLWLLEIQLGELAELGRDATPGDGAEPSAGAGVGEQSTDTSGKAKERSTEIRRLKEQLYCFLNRPQVFQVVTDNQAAVYRMVSAHLDLDIQLHLARKLRDHQTVIKILLMQGGHKEVLQILAKEARPELFYEYGEQLVREVPEELVALLLRHERALDLLRLLPAFQKCLEPEQANRAKIVDATFAFIHAISLADAPSALLDFAIHLFATFRPRELLAFLRKCLAATKTRRGTNSAPFDMAKALRVCTEHGLTECRVLLLCVEGLYEDATKLALGISTELAKQCARELDEAIEQCERENLADFVVMDGMQLEQGTRSSATMLREARRRVWLEIAKHMIQSGQPVGQCLALLAESKGAIRIQDVLVHFPDFTRIEHFREPLLECIEEYSTEIKVLQREIREATEMAQELREEIDKGKSSFMVVKAGTPCALCKCPLLQRPFVAFVCRHFFHRDCLECRVKAHSPEFGNLEAEQRLLKKELQLATTAEAKAKNGRNGKGGGREEIALRRLHSVQERMRELLCGDCALCGMHAIEEAAKPFFRSAEEYLEELKLWMP